MGNWPRDEQQAFRELMPRVRRGEFPDVEPTPEPAAAGRGPGPEPLLWEGPDA